MLAMGRQQPAYFGHQFPSLSRLRATGRSVLVGIACVQAFSGIRMVSIGSPILIVFPQFDPLVGTGSRRILMHFNGTI
jgi:hypothetical protein